MNRRDAIRMAGGATLAFASGCSHLPVQHRTGKVWVSPDRVIGQLAGLRPYRKPGFRIELEQFGDANVIHNYGHGGAGVTLSWGSAQAATKLVTSVGSASRQVAVLGCGVIGLTTARALQDAGYRVALYADKLSPDTTSNIAGALWAATTVANPKAHDAGFPTRLRDVARASYSYFTKTMDAGSGVRFIDCYRVANGAPTQTAQPWESALTPELFPGRRELHKDENPFRTDRGSVYSALYIDPNIYLQRLMQDFRLAGGTLTIRRFNDVMSVLSLPEKLIVNCTGLGARGIFGDDALVPVKGQLVALLPQRDVDYVLFSPAGYLMCRSNAIVLGGSHEEGNWDDSVDPQVSERILSRHQAFFAGY